MNHTIKKLLTVLSVGAVLLFASPITYAQLESSQKRTVQETVEIFNVKITEKEGSRVAAEFIGLTDQAKQLGFDQMSLVGNVTEVDRDPSGVITYDIVWDSARYEGSTAENRLTRPFETKGVRVKPDLSLNDVVNAKGSFEEVMAVKEEVLKEEAEEEKEAEEKTKEEEEEESTATRSSSGTPLGNQGGTSEDEVEGFSPNFAQAEPEDVISADGCDVVADITARTANQYKRVFRDGEPITSCAPSDEEYALTEDYTICSPDVQLPNGVFEQYTLGYQTEENGQRIVVNSGQCYTDETRPLPLTVNQCGYAADGEDELTYYRREEISYQHQGATFIAQPCSNTTDSYQRQTNTTTCEAQVNVEQRTRTPFVYYYIMVNGQEVTVSGCVPDTENVQNLLTEECTGSSKWFFDEGNTNLAFLQQRYYYDNSGDNQYVTACEPSATSYNVAWSSTDCPIINDDTNLRSNVNQKPLVLLDPDTFTTEEIVGEGCRDTGNLVAYTQNGGIWKLFQSLGTQPITPANTEKPSSYVDVGWVSAARKSYSTFSGKTGPWHDTPNSWFHFNTNPPSCLVMQGPAWCLGRNVKAPWHYEAANVDLDTSNSDQTPYIGELRLGGAVSGASGNESPPRGKDASGYCGGVDYFTCTVGESPTCLVTHLKKYQNYDRPDGSSYASTAAVLDETFVCGNGSLLNGVIE